MPPRKTRAEYSRTSRAYKVANKTQARLLLASRKMRGYQSSMRPKVVHRVRDGRRHSRGGWQPGDVAFNQQAGTWQERVHARQAWDELLDDAGAVGELDEVALWEWARD